MTDPALPSPPPHFGEQPSGADEQGERRSYLRTSKSVVGSLILVTPLFIFYQIGILTTDGWKNGVDFVTPRLYALLDYSKWLYLGFNLLIVATIVATARFMRSTTRPSPTQWLFVLLETALYASVMGGLITRLLLELGLQPPSFSMSVMDNLVLSFGAGAYEELVFRLLLLSGLLWAGRRVGMKGVVLFATAFALDAALFSVFHYAPLGSDDWQLWSFTYRFAAGIVFAALFVARGFAVAAYTHAFYDVFVLVL